MDAQRCAYCKSDEPALERTPPSVTAAAGALQPLLAQVGAHLENLAVNHRISADAVPCRTEMSPQEFAQLQRAMESTLQDLGDAHPSLKTCIQSYPGNQLYDESKRLQCLAQQLPQIVQQAETTLAHARALLNTADNVLQTSSTTCTCSTLP